MAAVGVCFMEAVDINVHNRDASVLEELVQFSANRRTPGTSHSLYFEDAYAIRHSVLKRLYVGSMLCAFSLRSNGFVSVSAFASFRGCVGDSCAIRCVAHLLV
jgi:hypothetical protein